MSLDMDRNLRFLLVVDLSNPPFIKQQTLFTMLPCSKHLLQTQVLKTYLSRHNPSASRVNQDTTHLALNATQGHKPSYTTGYILIPNERVDEIVPLVWH